MGCGVNQMCAIKKCNNLYGFGEDVVIQFAHLGFNAAERGIGVRAFLEQHDTVDDIRIVDKLAIRTMDGSAVLAEPDLGPLLDDGDVFHAQGRSSLGFDESIFNLLNVGEEADSLYVDLLRTGNNKAAASIGVIVG